MKLSKEDKQQLVALGHAYVAAVEKYASHNFTFDAAVECMRDMQKNLFRPMLAVMMRYADMMSHKMDEMSHASSLNFIKKLKLLSQVRDLQKILKTLQKEIFTKEVYEKFKTLFKDAPIESLNINEKENTHTTSSRDQFGFFRTETQRTHVLDCMVKFKNGRTLTWHTLEDGPDLEQAREVYNENLKQLGHVDIPLLKKAV